MGFGKFLVGGVCAAGAIVAAPVILPAVGFAAIGTGAIGTTVGLGLMTASSTTLAVGAGAVAGVAGVAAGASQEKKLDKARQEGCQQGYIKASDRYAAKFKKQGEELSSLREKVDDYIKKSKKNEEDKRIFTQDLLNYIDKLEYEIAQLKEDWSEGNEQYIYNLEAYKQIAQNKIYELQGS